MTIRKEDTSLEFERMILATMMLCPADCWRVELMPEHFQVEQHGEILRAIRELSQDSQPVDPVTVCEHFEKSGRNSLIKLTLSIAGAMTTVAPEAYAARVIANWRTRQARQIGAQLAASADATAVDSAIAQLMALHAIEQKHEFTAKEAARSALSELTKIHEAGGKLPGVTTGLVDIDEKLGGLHAGDLIIIGGRAAMGKTAFMIGMAKAAAASGSPIGMISGEQPVEQVAMRMVAAAARIEAKAFRTARFDDADWTRVFGGFEQISSLPMYFLDRSAPTLAEVVRVARRWIHQYGIKALYIDYLQRVVGEGERKFEQVGNVARGLKNLARDLGIPVVALAQVARAVESRSSHVPRMGDLSDSSEIEKEADQILMLYRPGYYDDNAPQNVARVIVEKNRHGPTGTVEVTWRGGTMTFENHASDETFR